MDLIEEFTLPSKGLVYDKEIKWQNRIRAPRLKDKGIGDLTKKNKLQAGILDKTILEPLGISAYDLHTADFLYLNFKQRHLSSASKPYKVRVKCPFCQTQQDLDVDLGNIKINYLQEKPSYEFTTMDGETLKYTYLTPRKIDEAQEAADLFKEEYPETDQDVQLQELLRAVIVSIDGVKPTHSQMIDFISNMYIEDSEKFLTELTTVNFGLDLNQSAKCSNPNCNRPFNYILPV